MFVCICRAVSDARIRAAIDAGASTVDEVEAACGAGGDCGSCREEIQGIIIDQSALTAGRHAAGDGCANCPAARRDIPAHRAA